MLYEVITILSASKKRGLMFHFNEQQVSKRYRLMFLKLFNSYVNGLREYITENNIELDGYSGAKPADWWSDLNKEIKAKVGKGEIVQRAYNFV